MTNTPARNAQTAALEALIEAHAIELKLPTVRRRFKALAAEALREQQTPIAYLGALLEAEMAERAERREKRRLIDARFPQIKRLEDFRFAHIARKVVGVGSVGTRAWVILMLGRDGGDPLFLQAKEAQASVLEPYVGKSRYANAGQRVVEGQRMMQAASDIFLGWERAEGVDGVKRDFYIRQLRDWKGTRTGHRPLRPHRASRLR